MVSSTMELGQVNGIGRSSLIFAAFSEVFFFSKQLGYVTVISTA